MYTVAAEICFELGAHYEAAHEPERVSLSIYLCAHAGRKKRNFCLWCHIVTCVSEWKSSGLNSEYLLCRQSINQSNPQSATRAQEKPHPSATTRAANPATRSVAGLGG